MTSVLIATPAFGGQTYACFAESLAKTMVGAAARGLDVAFTYAGNESCIERARNELSWAFLTSGRDYLLFIDAENHLLRRVRFTMEGLESTQGAIAEVDFFEHREIAGVVWPTRFYERLRKPIPSLPVHDWRLIGLDVNRGLSEADIAGPSFSAKAAEAARPIK